MKSALKIALAGLLASTPIAAFAGQVTLTGSTPIVVVNVPLVPTKLQNMSATASARCWQRTVLGDPSAIPFDFVIKPGDSFDVDGTKIIYCTSLLPAGQSSLIGFNPSIVGSSVVSGGGGDASASNQVIGNGSLASIDGKTPNLVAGRQPVDGSGVTQPISAAALPLPTGASTAVNQVSGNTALASIDGKTPALVSGRVPVDGSAVTQPVSAASLPLPTGAATAANQTTANASLASIDGKTATLGQKPMSGSMPVVLASDQTPLNVIGPLTNAQLVAAGLATATRQDTANTSLASIDASGAKESTLAGLLSSYRVKWNGDVAPSDALQVACSFIAAPNPMADGNGISLQCDENGYLRTVITGNLPDFANPQNVNVASSLPSGNNTIGNVNQSLSEAGFSRITNGTNVAAVKAASTAAVVTDPAVVVAVSPNNTVAVNQTQLNGTAVSVNAGAGDAGTQRVALSSNSAGGATANPSFGRIQDGAGTTLGTVKPASTAVVASDTALVMAASPNGVGGATTLPSFGRLQDGTTTGLATVKATNTAPLAADTALVVAQPATYQLTGPASLSAVNTDLLTGTVNGWFDAAAYRQATVQVIGSAGITAGTIGFEQTNDTTLASAGVPVLAIEAGSQNAPGTALAIAANTQRIFQVSLTARYFRIRNVVGFTGGTVQASASFSSVVDGAQPLVSLAAGTNSIGNIGTVAAVTSAGIASALVTDIASAAITTTTTGALIATTNTQTMQFTQAVTAVSGTTPTMDTVVQECDAVPNCTDIYHFDRVTAAGFQISPKIPVNMGNIRFVRTLTGTTPSFTMSMVRRSGSDDAQNAPRRFYDRTIVPNTLGSTTAAWNIESASQCSVVFNSGAGTTASQVVAEYGPDGVNWTQGAATVVTTVLSGTTQILNGAVNAKFLRVRVTTAGTGQTLNYVQAQCK